MRRRPRVILLIESSRAYGRGCLQGIAAYVRVRGPWSCLHIERGLAEEVPAWMERLPADGIIARIENAALATFLQHRRLPTVDLRGRFNIPGFAMFDSDHDAIVRLAVEHFLERGFRHIGFCGFAGLDFSDRRRDALIRLLAKHRLVPLMYEMTDVAASASTVTLESAGSRHLRELAAWLKLLPKPAAILACNDSRGRQVLDACAAAELAVPEQIAVVGVDNDEVLCDLSDPPLSSVQPDAMRIGFDGAAALDRMIRLGKPAPRRVRLVSPRQLVVRRSSDVLAINDPVVSSALQIIQREACTGLNVEKLLDQMTISRATLERRFERFLGRSPKDEILRLRLNRVRLQLAESEDTLAQIAEATGFSSVAHLSVSFKNATSLSPGEFRRRHRPATKQH
jgi:LacI family transcriptional regulator